MKYLFFIPAFIFVVSCSNLEPESVTNHSPDIEPNTVLQEKINTGKDNFILLSNNPALEAFLVDLKKNVESQNMKGIYNQIDPLQMGIQAEDMQMDSCQNVKELFNLNNKTFSSNCDLINSISNWKYKGYKKIDTATFDVRGKTKLSDGTTQEFSLLINQLGEKTFVITGAVG